MQFYAQFHAQSDSDIPVGLFFCTSLLQKFHPEYSLCYKDYNTLQLYACVIKYIERLDLL